MNDNNQNFEVTITNESLLEDLIWMSYRYCIGRHTIAAAMHASNIAPLIDKLSDNRKQFIAKDIRREINSTINWKSNVTIEGYNDEYDAYTLALEYLMNHPEITDDTNYHWYINVDDGNVHIEKEEKQNNTYYQSFLNEYHDIEPWAKLAAYLDKTKYTTIKTKYKDDKVEELKCFKYMYVFQNQIEDMYTTKEMYISNPHRNVHVNKEFII